MCIEFPCVHGPSTFHLDTSQKCVEVYIKLDPEGSQNLKGDGCHRFCALSETSVGHVMTPFVPSISLNVPIAFGANDYNLSLLREKRMIPR